ncbi:MAG: HlyD family efflux transporter periplasmic adaptor subunit, partial [Planctomycetes bacterium]|nr:HlyD family efflux transporter periplasmic adaptor subunit [Planctomycetota bacterium]
AATVLLPKMVTDYIQRKTLDDAVTQARRRAVNSQLEQARLREREGSLRSPVDGIVLEAPVDAPQHLGFGELVCVVGQLSELEIETDILSEDAVRITRGDACAITGPALAAAPEGALQGIVERVSPNAFMKVSSLGVEQQRVKVVVRLDDDQIAAARQANLGVGYQVDVRIITDERDDVLQIPRSALFRDRDGRWQVFVIARGKAERRAVSIGIQSDTHAEVLSGLEPSDIVITEPESRITEGARVRPF